MLFPGVACRPEFPRTDSVTAPVSSTAASARPRVATAVSLIALAGSLRAECKTEVLPCRPTIDDRLQFQLGGNGPTFADGPISQRFQDDLTLGAKLRLLRSLSVFAGLTPARL